MSKNEKIKILLENVRTSVSDFEPVYLHQLSPEDQMTRFDRKFIFFSYLIPDIISELKDYYRILEIENRRLMSYQSEYFDTPDYTMYNDHHNGKTNRFKIRLRKYLETGDTFLEIKKKNNKGLMIKRRVEVNKDGVISSSAQDLIKKRTPYDFDGLIKTVRSQFYRMTLQNICQQERVTIDCCLSLFFNNRDVVLPGLGIMEVKKCDIHKTSKIEEILKNKAIYPTNFSKYCTGLALLSKKVKYNNFKEKILTINQYENEFERFSSKYGN